MKTPRRTFWQWQGGEPCLNKRDEPRCTMLEQVTRWKRKNRTRQLKHTIARLKEENEQLRIESALRAGTLAKVISYAELLKSTFNPV